jgi:hypothetical protein
MVSGTAGLGGNDGFRDGPGWLRRSLVSGSVGRGDFELDGG